jgi:prophage DNA circulation protein
MNASEREEATNVVVGVVADIQANITIDAGRPGSMLRLACGDILADAEALIEAAAIAAPLASVFDLARQAGATVEQMEIVRAHAAALVLRGFPALSVADTSIRFALVQSVRILAATDFTSRPQVDGYIDLMNAAFDAAETVAANRFDQASYRSLVQLHAAVTFDLVSRERTLPTIVFYNFAVPRPALWIANRLYGGEDRAQELVNENRPVHPAFMQMPVRALSQ